MARSIWKWLRRRQPEREAAGTPADGHCRLVLSPRLGHLAQPGVHNVVIIRDREAGQ